MFSKLKAAWARMTGGRAAGESDEPNTPAIEYQGYRIRPTPYRTEGQYQTAGIIEKNFPDGPKQHRFVRADTHHNRDDRGCLCDLEGQADHRSARRPHVHLNERRVTPSPASEKWHTTGPSADQVRFGS